MNKIIFTYSLALGSLLGAVENSDVKDVAPSPDIGKVSKAFGHLIGQNLGSLGLDFNMKEVIAGIQDSMNGVEPPMSETECIQAIAIIQENAFQRQALTNLKNAEEFLIKNSSAQGVVEVEPGKLQYLRLKEGTGATVEPNFAPMVRYTGTSMDGKVFSEAGEEMVLSLDETIEGFRRGIPGMKEGEIRRVFIHPELGEGVEALVPPNSLLTFDIEVLKANTAQASEVLSTTPLSSQLKSSSEIASIDAAKEAVR